MRLKPFFSYYGGKHRHVARYPVPRHRTVVECFAGSAGYATRWHTADVVLADTDERVCGIWDYLIRVRASEVMALPLIAADESLDALGCVPQEARWLVGFWLGKALATPRLTPSPWMRSGKWPSCFWGESIRSRVARQVEHIRHWKIARGSYADLPRPEATWFVDPPYVGKGIYYRKGAGGIDYAHLGMWCRMLPGQVIVCENEGANWLPFEPFMQMKTLNRKDGSRSYSKEVVWHGGDEWEPCDLFEAA